jgi:hypothetical protein
MKINVLVLILAIVETILIVYLAIEYINLLLNYKKECIIYNPPNCKIVSENLTHGMFYNFSNNEIILVSKAVYYRKTKEETIRAVVCEECGVGQNCLENNLLSIRRNYPELNITSSDLISFSFFTISFAEVKNQQRENENFQSAYERVFNDKCGGGK